MRPARQHVSFALAGLLAGTLQAQVDYFPEETVFKQTYDASLIGLCGRVVDQTGAPLPGCDVQLDSGESVVTSPDGTFVLTGLIRSNRLLTVTAPGFYRQILPVQLFVPLELTNVVLPTCRTLAGYTLGCSVPVWW